MEEMSKFLKESKEKLTDEENKQNYSKPENGNRSNKENTNWEFGKYKIQKSEKELQTQAELKRWKRDSQALKI